MSELLNVSEMTVRRDLKELEKEDIVWRTHGGAVFVQTPNPEPPFDEKRGAHLDLKERIAEYAANRFVRDDSVIFLEGGTTVTGMAGFLGQYRDLLIVTNGLYTASALKKIVSN
ncbi:DeoR/GlpR family DNA-binding transcription regulator [Paenibacillus sp. MSJ-34]|nr:DeoR/GlpR family DNA-binding transcription regulator [Paenibacillus sp. MSJ-34]